MHAPLASLTLFPAVDMNNFAMRTTEILVNKKQLLEYNLAFC